MSKTNPTLAAKIAASGVDHLADDMWNNLGGTYRAIVELEVAERTEPADDETDRKVKLQVVGIEVAPDDREDERLRHQARDYYADRTGEDSLFDHGAVDGPGDDDIDVTITHNGQSVDTTTGQIHAMADRLGADI